MFFLFIYKNYLYINKSIINNDSYHFLRIHYVPGTLLRALFFKFFSVEVGTSIISPFHILSK